MFFPNDRLDKHNILEHFESPNDGGGHRFYRDRVKEAYRPLYD